MGSKNLTSTTKKLVVMMEKAVTTRGDKCERPVRLYLYNPFNSSFEYHNFYGRMRDALRGIKRICNKYNTDFRVVYLKG